MENGCIAAKPYVSFRVSTTGGVASAVLGAATTIGTPGTVTITSFGFNTSVVCIRGTSGNVNAFVYTFTWAGAHPLGAHFGTKCALLHHVDLISSALGRNKCNFCRDIDYRMAAHNCRKRQQCAPRW